MGQRGPLPKPDDQRARRNAPTIPTTNLPASGREGDVPEPPEWIALGAAGLAWWTWAWKTPQAAAWSDGDLCIIARRASLEDDLAVQGTVDTIDLVLADIADAETTAQVRAIIGKLAAIATGRTGICREMRELDNLLGLSPKGMAALHWKIVADKKATVTAIDGGKSAPDFKNTGS
jgi:hypothetical protein